MTNLYSTNIACETGKKKMAGRYWHHLSSFGRVCLKERLFYP